MRWSLGDKKHRWKEINLNQEKQIDLTICLNYTLQLNGPSLTKYNFVKRNKTIKVSQWAIINNWSLVTVTEPLKHCRTGWWATKTLGSLRRTLTTTSLLAWWKLHQAASTSNQQVSLTSSPVQLIWAHSNIHCIWQQVL